MYSATCSFAPHSQAAAEAIPHLCVSERNRPTSVRRGLSLIHAGLGKQISGGVGLTSLINVWSREMFFRHSMLHLYSAHRATLVTDWMWSLSSSSADGTNGSLYLSSHNCARSKDRTLLYSRYSDRWARRAWDSTGFWWQSSVGWIPAKINRLSIDMGRKHPVTMRKVLLIQRLCFVILFFKLDCSRVCFLLLKVPHALDVVGFL